jgi:hypothetical protein
VARIRTIKPDLFRSPSMRHLPLEARFFVVGLITEADDEGRFVASSKALAGALFPHDAAVTAARIERWLHLAVGIGTVQLYDCDGVRYGWFPMWGEHQRISHPAPSRLPNPPGVSPEPLRNVSALNREQGKEREQGSAATAAAFEEFWKAYPREGRHDKPKVLVAFKSACRKAETRDIITAAARYAADPNRSPDKTKYAQGWLTGERWTEDPLPPRLAPGIIPTPRRQSREDWEAERDALAAQVEP